ncbi:MAG: enoyl-CoA hydratase-related protein [Rhodospirillales bacterium]
MTDNVISIEQSNGVATLTMNRPDVHNAFDDVLVGELAAALGPLADDEDVWAMVLKGAGKSFSAGADLNWMKRMADYTEAENLSDANAMADMLRALNEFPKPVIAKVQGAALGGGVGLVACADIAVAADDAKFALSEVKLGLIPATISPYVIAAIGERQSRRYMLTGERFEAIEAKRIGLIHAVVASTDLDAAVDDVIGGLLANGPLAMIETKALIRSVAGRPMDKAISADTAARIAKTRASEEGREGVLAFLEKRRPEWG